MKSVFFQRSVWLLDRSDIEIRLSGGDWSVDRKKSPSYQDSESSDSEDHISTRLSPVAASPGHPDSSDSETSSLHPRSRRGSKMSSREEQSSKTQHSSHLAHSTALTSAPSTALTTAPSGFQSVSSGEIANLRKRYVHNEEGRSSPPLDKEELERLGIDVSGSNFQFPELIELMQTGNPITLGGSMETGTVAATETALVTVNDPPLTVETTPIAPRRFRPPPKIQRPGPQSASKGKLSGKSLMQRDISSQVEAADKTDNITGILDMYAGGAKVAYPVHSTPTTAPRVQKRARVEEEPRDTHADAGGSASKMSVSVPNRIEYISNIPHFDTKDTMTTEEQEIVRQMTSLIPKFGSNLLTKDNELKQIREYGLTAVACHANRISNYHTAFKNNVDIVGEFVKTKRGEVNLPDFSSSSPIVNEVQRNFAFLNTEAQNYYNFAKLTSANLERLTSYNRELEARAVRMDKDLEQQRMENERLNNELLKSSHFQMHNEKLTNFINETYSKYYGTYRTMFELWRDPTEANRNAAAMEMRSIRDGIIKRCGNVSLPSVPSSLTPPSVIAGIDEGATQDVEESPQPSPTTSPDGRQ